MMSDKHVLNPYCIPTYYPAGQGALQPRSKSEDAWQAELVHQKLAHSFTVSQFWLILDVLHLRCNFKRCIFINTGTESCWVRQVDFHEYIKKSKQFQTALDQM